jgi:hypothetical protein
VVAIVGAWRLIEQVAADLADVLAAGHAVAAHVVPEAPGAEAAGERDAGTLGERAGDHHHAAGGVVER